MPTPRYDLHTLGWNSFQDLCHTISREILGQTVQRFSNYNDGGRDGAFEGTWTTTGQESFLGPLVIQCKFTERAHYYLTHSDIAEELSKTDALVRDGRCSTYILITNANVTATTAETIEASYRATGVQHFALYESNWLRQQITESSRLRSLVPRVYGLGDLSAILDSRANDQTRAIMSSLQDDMAPIVVTDTYRKAALALQDRSFVLLLGSPASGKTTIAAQLTMIALDLWEAQTYKITRPEEMQQHWNPHEPHQFFWIDDAFGPTQYDASLVDSWNRHIPTLKAMLKRGARIVLTSRDYIYRRARQHLKTTEFPVLTDSQVVVEVERLSLREKEQILYNHIKLGTQPKNFRRLVKKYLPGIAANAQFTPETARRLGNPYFTTALKLDDPSISRFVEHPEAFLMDVIDEMDIDSRAALALLFMHNGELDGLLNLSPSDKHALERMGTDLGSCATALKALEAGFVRYDPDPSSPGWRFKHPTVSDAVSALLAKRPDLVDILVEGGQTRRLMSQITCGDVGLEQAVIVPTSLYPRVSDKLNSASTLAATAGVAGDGKLLAGEVAVFLTNRCSSQFLVYHIDRHPGVMRDLHISHSNISHDPSAHLVRRLHEHGLLPDWKRSAIVESTLEHAIDEDTFWEVDVAALKYGPLRSVLTAEEVEEIETALRTEIVPMIDSVRDSWESSYSSADSPDGWLEPLESYCRSIKEYFRDEWDIVEEVELQERYMEDWVAENSVEDPRDDWKYWAEQEEAASVRSERSTFDDIDK